MITLSTWAEPLRKKDGANNVVKRGIRIMLLLLGIPPKLISSNIFPQQRKLTGSSAQISSGVCRCGSQEQVPEEGSKRFRRVPVCAGVGSGREFQCVLV